MDHGMMRKGEDALFGKPNCEMPTVPKWWKDDFLIGNSLCNGNQQRKHEWLRGASKQDLLMQ